MATIRKLLQRVGFARGHEFYGRAVPPSASGWFSEY